MGEKTKRTWKRQKLLYHSIEIKLKKIVKNVSCIWVQLLVQWTVRQRFIGNEGKEEQTTCNPFAFSTSLTGRQPSRNSSSFTNLYHAFTRNFTTFRTQPQTVSVELSVLFLPFIQSLSQTEKRPSVKKNTSCFGRYTHRQTIQDSRRRAHKFNTI